MARDEAYFNTEKIIEATLGTGAIELDLSNMGLTELPESLGNLTQLLFLDLSNNQLAILPESLGNLSQLQSLILSNNQLKSPPDILSQLPQLWVLDISDNQLVTLPESFGQLVNLRSLNLSNNELSVLPEFVGNFANLEILNIESNPIGELPSQIGKLSKLQVLAAGSTKIKLLPIEITQLKKLNTLLLWNCEFTVFPSDIFQLVNLTRLSIGKYLDDLPDKINKLANLRELDISNNRLKRLPRTISYLTNLTNLVLGDYSGGNLLTDLPYEIAKLERLEKLRLDENPLNAELAAAYKQGLDVVKAYLRAKAAVQITLNEAKLILIGQGQAGRYRLLGALRGEPWEEGQPTTHSIEITPVKVTDPDSGREIILNSWDLGDPRALHPIQPLFFSTPAVYLVVWNSSEVFQEGNVKEWINRIKLKEPDAKILVVITHDGPRQRQSDINLQNLQELFGKDTVLGFFEVETEPGENGNWRGIEELQQGIARVASTFPGMGRAIPNRWQDVRDVLAKTEESYLPLEHVLKLCRTHQMGDGEARLFVTISHRLGRLLHYQHDNILRNTVILKPDWLATAIRLVLDEEAIQNAHGLVRLSGLRKVWHNPSRAEEFRYPATLHPFFLRLMAHFALSYHVPELSQDEDSDPLILITPHVPADRPVQDLKREWSHSVNVGDNQQVQICRIVDRETGKSATVDGLFYLLIVRLHKFSLGREDFTHSIHWQRGLLLDDDYNGRALLEYMDNDVKITVRAPYPERFLATLTGEVKYLVEGLWKDLRCDMAVPCVTPCGRNAPGTGMFDVKNLIDSKKRNRSEYPCPMCNEWQNIDNLLRSTPVPRAETAAGQFPEFNEIIKELVKIRQHMTYIGEKIMGRFNRLDDRTRRILSRISKS